MSEISKTPFSSFGRRLRALRERAKESIEDVSGAIEIAIEELAKIERGEVRPAEDTLQLLISHFDPADNEAGKLWELAGYREEQVIDPTQTIASITIMPVDGRIVYSDMAQVTLNNFGVVMNFIASWRLQAAGSYRAHRHEQGAR